MSFKNNTLIEAINEGQVAIVKDLLAKGIDPNTRIEKEKEVGWPALLIAACNGNIQLVRLLIEHGADINAATDDGETALSLAAFEGNLELIVYLLDQGMKIRDTRNYKALHHAAGEGHNEIVRYLITKGMPVDARDSGWTALLIAAQEGLLDTVTILIDQGADIHAKAAGSDGMGLNVLMMAACEGHTDVVRFLTGCGVDLEKTSDDGWTALMWAAQKGLLDVVKVLIEQGADINRSVKKKDWRGYSALIFAVSEGHTDVVRFLTEHGAETEAKILHGWTALMLAALKGHSDIVAGLLDHGADIRVKDTDNRTALIIAVRRGHHRIVRYLIEKGAPVNSRYNDRTALIWAAHGGFTETVKVLIEKGADIEASVKKDDWKGFTAFMFAAHEGHTEIVRFLITRAADLNVRDDKGISALIWAARYGYLDIVEILTDHGVDLNAQDQNGQTAVTYAHQYWQREILKELIKKGAKNPLLGGSLWLKTAWFLVKVPMGLFLSVKMFYESRKKLRPVSTTHRKRRLKKGDFSETMNLRWSYKIPEAVWVTYGSWESNGKQNIIVADKKKQLYVFDLNGSVTRILPLPAEFRYIECGRHKKHGVRLLGISKKSSYLYVINQEGKTIWRYSRWLGISGAHWGDLNGDGNDELVLPIGMRGNLAALTDEGELLWKSSNTPGFSCQPLKHIIVPHSSDRQALIPATYTDGTIKVYNHSGKLLRILQPALFPGSIAGQVIDSSGRLQFATIGCEAEKNKLIYKIYIFDLSGYVVWEKRVCKDSWKNKHLICGDINADGIREWAFIEKPGELVFVSDKGEKLTTLSGQEEVEKFMIVPESGGYGILLTLQAGLLKAYQFNQ